MNIEDVKKLSEIELNRKLSVLTGYTDSCMEFVNGEWSKMCLTQDVWRGYTHDLETAREAQAKAIKVNANKYVATLYDVMYFDEGVPPDPTDNFQEVTYRGHGVAYMLQATPRQISEASYLTLQEVQDNES
jgi:hypothetical protein